ncbi:MAG: hypothetical protein OHK0045_16530 [Raineya sp.]
MKRLFISLVCSGVLSTIAFSQGVGIGGTPDASAKLDVTDANRGILIPRVALSATNVAAPVTGPATSLLVYNTATAGTFPNNVWPGYYYWNGTQWVRVGSDGGDWSIRGNTLTGGAANTPNEVLGSNNNYQLHIRTNGALRFRVANDQPQLLAEGNGTVGRPSYSWNSDNSSGMYRFGVGAISFATQGVERLRITNTPQILSVGDGTAASPAWSWTANTNTGIYRAGLNQIGIATAGVFRINIGAQNGSFGFNKVPSASRIPGLQFFEIYTPLEIGDDAGFNTQATIGYWRGGDVELSPEANMWGYVGYVGGSAANPAWWRMYSYGFINVSRRELKKNIVSVNDDLALEQWVLNDIKNIKPSFYHYNNEEDKWNSKLSTKYRPHYHLGVIVDESPDYVKDEAFSGIDGYSLASLSLAGTKYCIKQLEEGTISDFGTVQFHGKQMVVKYSDAFIKKLNGNVPVVQITLQDFTDAQLIVTNKTSEGFIIRSNKEISHLDIDWTAFAKPNPINSASFSLPSNVDVNRLKVPEAIKSNIQNYFFNLKATEKRIEE